MSYGNDLSLEDLEKGPRHLVKFSQSIGATRNKGLALLNLIYEKKLESLYPQVCICFQIFLSIPVSVASGERSFSKLAFKEPFTCNNDPRQTIEPHYSFDRARTSKTNDYDNIMDQFATEKARKIHF